VDQRDLVHGLRRRLDPVAEVVVVRGVEDEHWNRHELTAVEEFVHDVEVLVAEKDLEVEAGLLGHLRHYGQTAYDIRAPGFAEREALACATINEAFEGSYVGRVKIGRAHV